MKTQKLKALRSKRNPAACDKIFQELNDKAANGDNIMRTVIEAVENYCTLG